MHGCGAIGATPPPWARTSGRGSACWRTRGRQSCPRTCPAPGVATRCGTLTSRQLATAASPASGEKGAHGEGPPALQGQLKQPQPPHRAREPAGIPWTHPLFAGGSPPQSHPVALGYHGMLPHTRPRRRRTPPPLVPIPASGGALAFLSTGFRGRRVSYGLLDACDFPGADAEPRWRGDRDGDRDGPGRNGS